MGALFPGLCLLAHVASIVADRPRFPGSPLEVEIEGWNIGPGVAKRRRSVRAAKISFKKAVDMALMPSAIVRKRKCEMDLEWENIADGSAAAVPYCAKLPRTSASRFAFVHPVRLNGSDSELESIILPETSSGDAFEAALPGYTELPAALCSTIQSLCASDVKLILEKKLTCSDLKKSQARLLLPERQLLSDFLNPEESKMLETGSGENIAVKVIEPCLRVSTLSLRRWTMRSCHVFVLNAGWNKIAHDPLNDLQEDDLVQVWSFRVLRKLWFVMMKASSGVSTGSAGPSSPSSTVTDA